jgi:hypothetical protein
MGGFDAVHSACTHASVQQHRSYQNLVSIRAWFRMRGEMGGNWCRLERDGAAIMFMRNEHVGTPKATATQYIYTDDVMILWNSIKDRCTAEWGPELMPYGMLEFAIKDLNGYLLSFGQKVD